MVNRSERRGRRGIPARDDDVREQATGKGGIVELGPLSLGAGQTTATQPDVVALTANIGRISGTVFERLQLVATGDLADPEELRKLTLTIEVNRRPLPVLQGVPLDLLYRRSIDLETVIPADAEIRARVTLTEDLTTAADNTLTLRLWSNGQTPLGDRTAFRGQW